LNNKSSASPAFDSVGSSWKESVGSGVDTGGSTKGKDERERDMRATKGLEGSDRTMGLAVSLGNVLGSCRIIFGGGNKFKLVREKQPGCWLGVEVLYQQQRESL